MANKFLPAAVIVGGLGIIAAITFDGGIMTVVTVTLGFVVLVGNALAKEISESSRKFQMGMLVVMAVYAVMVATSSKVSEDIWRMPATGIQKAK